MTRFFCRAIMVLLCIVGGVRAQTEPKKQTAPYATAHSQALDAKEAIVNEANDHTLLRVEFNGIKGDRVPAFLYVPKRKENPVPAPHAAVLLQYGIGGNKKTDYIVAIGKQFVARGFIVLTIDSPGSGERKLDKQSTGIFGKMSPEGMMQTCGDYSRALDFLAGRPNVDRERLGYVGISWGAITGITYVAHEPRIKAMASLVGGGNFFGLYSPKAAEKAAKEGSRLSDPIVHVARIAPRPLLFINVTRDQLIPSLWSESLHRTAGPGSKVVWLETDHYFRNVDRNVVCESVIDFMEAELAAKPRKK
jgi:dienelactone hydrolase